MTVDDRRDDDERFHVQESGGFHRWVPYAAITVIVVIACVGIRACWTDNNPTISKHDLESSDDQTAAFVAGLRIHHAEPTPIVALIVATPLPVTVAPPQQMTISPPRQLSADEEARRQLRIKAFSAPQMVTSFHASNALVIPGHGDGTLPPKGALHLNAPAPPFSVMAGGIIPAVLVTGINSDNPSDVLAMVTENVMDSLTGASIVIPQGTKLLGKAGGADHSGQDRISIAWQRLIFPNTASMDLPTMPGLDQSGQGGFTDQVNNHYLRTFGLAALTSVISAAQYMGSNNLLGAQGGNQFTGSYNSNPNALAMQNVSSATSANMGGVADRLARRGMDTPPTIVIRPGYRFDVMITTDLTFPGPYADKGAVQ